MASIEPYTSGSEEESEEESQEELTSVIEPVIKVNWTQHGGGTDGYYYFTKQGGKGAMNAIHEDFVDVKDLLEEINKALPEGRTIKCLKIFRWTSPGAVIVSNEDIDDQFRAFFEHPLWHDIYANQQLNTRGGMGANLPAKEKVVGSDDGIKRGPGELLKDLHLAKYCIGDEEKSGYVPNIFTNEIISSEYKNKYTQMVSEDFGLWLLRETGDYGSVRGTEDVQFQRAFPEEWMQKTLKERKQALQKMHNDIFMIGKGQAGDTLGSKMSVVIKNIILKCSDVVVDDGEWNTYCQNWEFYPISCSPMNGVEGKKELLRFDYGGASKELKSAHDTLTASLKELYEYEPEGEVGKERKKELLKIAEQNHIELEGEIEKEDKNKMVIRKRLNANSGLWFAYMLNMARRCWVFLEGKDIRKKYIEEAIESTKDNELQDSVDKIGPELVQFENSFDVLDPDERKQLYTDINGILQNVRPNQEKQKAQQQGENITFFRNAQILKSGGGVDKFNLFIDKELEEYMGLLTQGVKLDGRPNLFSKIEEDWMKGEPSLLDKITAFADERFKELSEKQNEYESVNTENIPKLIKILFYVLYSCSHKEDGIAKEYWSDPNVENNVTLMGKLNHAMAKRKKEKPNESMGWELGKFMPSWVSEYDFGNAVNGFFKSVWADKYVSISKQGNGGRIGNGVLKQLDSVMGGKKQLAEGEQEYYKYLRTGFDFVRPIRADINAIMRDTTFHKDVMAKYTGQQSSETKLLSEIFIEETVDHLLSKFTGTEKTYRYTQEMIKTEIESLINRKQILIPEPNEGKYSWPVAITPRHELVVLNGDSTGRKMGFHLVKGGKKKRKKRTRRKRKKKRKRTRKRKKRKCKKRMKKKIICLSAPNKKATRKLIRVTKKLGRMKGIRLSKCSKQRIKKWAKKKKRTRRRRKR